LIGFGRVDGSPVNPLPNIQAVSESSCGLDPETPADLYAPPWRLHRKRLQRRTNNRNLCR
jgi:hypothetical protein